jgi:hypothetical protein
MISDKAAWCGQQGATEALLLDLSNTVFKLSIKHDPMAAIRDELN